MLVLLPTSESIRLHILRAFYIVYTQTKILDINIPKLNSIDFGFKIEDNLLVSEKIHILLSPSDELIVNCTCKKCSRLTCPCVAGKIPCCSFCFCQRDNTCKNVYNNKDSIDK